MIKINREEQEDSFKLKIRQHLVYLKLKKEKNANVLVNSTK